MEKSRREIVVRTLDDLKAIISPYLETVSMGSTKVSAKMEWVDDDGKSRETTATADSRDITSKRIMIEGFDLVKVRMELAAKAKEQAEQDEDDEDLLPERLKWGLFDPDSQYFHVDKLIKQEFDGKRKGLRVRWELEEGNFEYDPYIGKLFKVD